MPGHGCLLVWDLALLVWICGILFRLKIEAFSRGVPSVQMVAVLGEYPYYENLYSMLFPQMMIDMTSRCCKL
jgi:hypothetical protein